MLVVMLVALTLGFMVLAAVVILLLVRFTGLRTDFVGLYGDATVIARLTEGQLRLGRRLTAERDKLMRENGRLAEMLTEEIAIPPDERRETPVPEAVPVEAPAEGGTIPEPTRRMVAGLQLPEDVRTTRVKVAAPSDEDLAAARAGRPPGARRAARPGHLAPASRRSPPPVAPATDAPPPVPWNAALPAAPAWAVKAAAPGVVAPPAALLPPATTDADDSSDETQILLSTEAIDAVLAAQPLARKGTLLGLAPTPEPPPSGSAPFKGAT